MTRRFARGEKSRCVKGVSDHVRRLVAPLFTVLERIIGIGEVSPVMTLVIALSDLALRLSGLLAGASYVVKVEDGTDLRHRVHSYQPDIIVLDWRIGGSKWKAIEEVTAIVERTATHPYVIVLLPKVSGKIKSEAAKAGCYNVVSADGAGLEKRVAYAVSVAQKARKARSPDPRRVSRQSLH